MKFCNSCMEPYEEGDRCPKCGYSDSDSVKESLHLPIGSIIKDRYTIGKVLGSGAFGVTYISWDRKSGRKVLVKEYLPGEFATRMPGKTAVTMFTDDKKQKQFHDGLVKFVEEAEKLRQLPPDSGVAQVLDSFNFNNTAYIVSEFLEGETLAQKLGRERTLPVAEAIELILPIINSIQLVHSQGMIHSNICPENIFITTDGKVKLIDFAAYRTATTSHSRSLSVVVNAGYSAEEQYRSRSDQGAYTDVYSLGAVLYRMITGETPPDAFERRASYERDKRDIIKPFRRGVLRSQATAIMNALNVRIEDRTQEAATLAQELTSDKKVTRRGNKIRVIDNGKLKKGIIVASAIAIGCIASIIALFASGIIDFGDGGFGSSPIPDGMTRVPSVIGQDLTMSQETLSNANLQLSISDKQYSKEIPADFVLSQDIKAGSIVDANTIVSLTISGGQEMKLVPLVEGDTIKNAKIMLESLGFVVETEKSPSLYKSEGIVFSQDIEANTELAVGESITLKVSNGEVIKGVAYIETVPDLTGLTLAEATDKLMALASVGKNDGKPFGLDENVSKDYSKTIPAGRILSQNLKAGTQEMTDKLFKFIISLGIHYVMLPDVQYQPLANAKEKLKLSGESQFTLNVSETTDENVVRGNVISQSPAGDIRVEFDSSVSLNVSLGPREFPMPKVEGKTKDDATAELNNNGITSIVYNETRNDDIPIGSIVSQSPASGVTVTSKTKVELSVSIGKILRTVPDVTNRSSYDAERRIKEAKLTMRMYEDYSNTVTKGNVISQQPTSGELETGSEVIIIVSKGRRPVAVPDVVGQEALRAERTLNGVMLNVKYGTEDYDEDIPKDAIKSQNPTAGREVFEGDTVTLVISKGPKPVIVPDVRNKTEDDAEFALENKRFYVNIEYEESTEIEKDRVIYQDPSAGTSAPRDSEVTIIVSLGIRVPDVIGNNESAARSVLTSQNLKSTVRYEESTTVPKGEVIDQTPSSREYVNRYTTITLYVSSGTNVPDVRGYDQSDAESTIQAAGLQVIVREYESKTVPKGQVISQNPLGGTNASADDTVTITVSSGIAVPNVVGQSQSIASSTLSSAGLQVYVIEGESTTVLRGNVISQSPSEGTNVSVGDTVTITVNSGITVPDIVGRSQSSAEDSLQSKGFYVIVQSAQSDTVPTGEVISQTPIGGSAANPGDTVTITVSLGDGKVDVPDVTGYDQSSAINMLDLAGLEYIIETAYSDTVPTGEVISQTPVGGSAANPGDTVTITVSLDDGKVDVPDVTGYDQATAINMLDLAGLEYIIETAYSDTVASEYVISQLPTSEERVAPNSTITLVVSLGLEEVTVDE